MYIFITILHLLFTMEIKLLTVCLYGMVNYLSSPNEAEIIQHEISIIFLFLLTRQMLWDN